MIEFKVKPNRLSAEQRTRIEELVAAGNQVYVIEETDPEKPGEAYSLATALVRSYYNLPEGLE